MPGTQFDVQIVQGKAYLQTVLIVHYAKNREQ